MRLLCLKAIPFFASSCSYHYQKILPRMSERRRLLLLSSSVVHGFEYLDFARNDIIELLKSNDVKTVTFIPYALYDRNAYEEKVGSCFRKWGFKLESIHHASDPVAMIDNAEAIFIGGGNTFVLLNELYKQDLVEIIRKRVLIDGIPYIGSSAGTNVATANICTTNDMPIVYPPSFEALNLVPFNINPHYIDEDPSTTHMGESRDLRIKQYHEHGARTPVVGLREGSMLEVKGNRITLKGIKGAKIFKPNFIPIEYVVGNDLTFLLKYIS